MKKTKLLLTLALIFMVIVSFIGTRVSATETEGGEYDIMPISEDTQGENTENPVVETNQEENSGENQEANPEENQEVNPEENTEENPEENQEQEHNHEELDIYEGDLYVFYSEDGNSTDYVMDKNVDGNVYIFGQNVTIKGQVNGSLYIFAPNVTIEEGAYIACDVFACAENIVLKGFAYDMYAACENFDMQNTGVVYRDLKLASSETKLVGSIGRDVDLVAKNITVFENEDDETALFVGRNFNYTSEKALENTDKIEVNGEIKYTEQKKEEADGNVVFDYIYRAIENAVFALIIYALIIFLAPKFVEKTKEYVSTRALLAGTVGAAFTIIVPIIAFILILTGIGVSLGFLTIIIYAIALFINSAVVTIAINEFISSKIETINSIWKKLLMIIPVSAVIFLIRQIPIIGGWVTIAIFLVGIGITVLYQFDKRKKEKVTE